MKARAGRRELFTIMGLLVFLVCLATPGYAAHPLITDDTSTQGKGKFQVEFNIEFTRDKVTDEEVTTKEKGGEASSILSIGMAERVDLIFGLPYQWSKVKENEEVISKERGVLDLSVEVKWRFWETEGLSFALKPGLTFRF